MPTFPKYRGELPQCLNPCNPRHYWLLAYWVYFRPTALHCYVYEAAPEYYQQRGWSKIRRTWHIPAYRSLYLMAPVAVLLFALLVGLLVGLWLLWTWLVPFWANYRLLAGLATVMFYCFVIIKVALIVTVILVLGEIIFGVIGSLSAGLFGSVVFIVGLVTATVPLTFFFELIGNDFGIGIATTMFNIYMSIAFSVALCTPISIALSVANRRASGVLGSVSLYLIIGVFHGLAIGVYDGTHLPEQATLLDRINTGLNTVSQSVIITLLFALLIQLGTLRLIFYPIQLALALRRRHPALWDELTVLPLPNTRRLLSQRLQQNEAAGLELVSEIVRNPFQRWVAQQALQIYLHKQPAPLHLLYKLLTEPGFNTYYVAPISKQDWKRMPTTGKLLMGELAGKWVNCSPVWGDRISDRLLWYLTRFRRDRRQTPLTRFAGMLYQLLDADFVNLEVFYLGNYRNIYARLTNYPGGVEIEQSFDAMASFLSYKKFSDLPAAVDILGAHIDIVGAHGSGATGALVRMRTPLPTDDTAIRPKVITSLHRLRDIASEVAAYLAASSKVNQLAALARATDALKTLDEYIAFLK